MTKVYSDDPEIERLATTKLAHLRGFFQDHGFEEALNRLARILVLQESKDKIYQELAERLEVAGREDGLRLGEMAGRASVAKAGGNAKKAKYAEMKSKALDWYARERGNFPNKNEAAIALTKIHTVEFSTAREWLKGV